MFVNKFINRPDVYQIYMVFDAAFEANTTLSCPIYWQHKHHIWLVRGPYPLDTKHYTFPKMTIMNSVNIRIKAFIMGRMFGLFIILYHQLKCCWKLTKQKSLDQYVHWSWASWVMLLHRIIYNSICFSVSSKWFSSYLSRSHRKIFNWWARANVVVKCRCYGIL